MTPRRLWLNKIPTQCDVVIEFPGKSQLGVQFLSIPLKKKPYAFIFLPAPVFAGVTEDAPDEALRWLLNKIKATPPEGLGLSTLVRAHDSTKRTAFYVTAPMNV